MTEKNPTALTPEAASQLIGELYPKALQDLKDLVAIPGIAWESFDPAELERSAEAVAQLAREAGFEDVRIHRATIDLAGRSFTGGPAIIASIPASDGAPTVLLYAHHDVQPPQDRALWDSEPFVAEERTGRLYGRGAADDKAGVMVHLAAVRALKKHFGGQVPVGITLFVEGEEEAGSPTFRAFLEEHREELRADAIIVADSSNWKVGTPALTTSLRGLVDGVLEVKVAEHASHSGMFGGPILDAPTVLARAIATLHNDRGEVAVAGLKSSEESAPVDYEEADFRRDAGLLESSKLAGTGSIVSRLWSKPALSVTAVDAPAVDVASNTLLSTARAKLSLRIAPGENPQEALKALGAHIDALDIFGSEIRFVPGEAGQPFRTETDQPFAQLALRSLGEAFGAEAVTTGMGGSIPFIADLKELYPAAEILITGVEDPDSRAHSANESLDLGDFRNAMVAETLLLAGAAGISPQR